MAGKQTVSTSEERINSFLVQKTSYGEPIAVLLGGTNRVAPNLFYYNGFHAIAKTTTTSAGGKGMGNVEQKTTTYTYRAGVMLGICEGPIEGVLSIMKDKDYFTDGATTALAQAGLSLATGTLGQAVWGWLTTNYPAEALGYSQLAYAYAADYLLNNSASLQNHTFEVQSSNRVSGKPDANPRDLVVELLTNDNYGVPGFTTALLGNLDSFASYALASNFLLSPLLDSQRPAQEILEELVSAANSEIFCSEGLIKIVPYGTETVTGNGETWTPDLTPLYDLDDRDFIADDDEDPIRVDINRGADAYNTIQIEILNRSRQYNIEMVSASDQVNIEEFGDRKKDPEQLHFICDPEIGKRVAQAKLQRSCYIRAKYTFRLGWKYALLEPMDLVTLTDPGLELDRQLVRITDIEEDEEGELTIEAEDVLVGVADAPVYPHQGSLGYASNYNADPGDVTTPYMFIPPSVLTTQGSEVWCAVAGGPDWGGCQVWTSLDDTSYKMIGTISGAARYGQLTADLIVGTDPDDTNLAKVDLTISNGTMLSASQEDVDSAATLMLVGEELICYRDATLTAANKYDLGYLRRGVLGTTVQHHTTGADIVRLDEAIFRFSYLAPQSGQTVYVKFQSFNVYGRALQDLADLSPYTVTPNSLPARPPLLPNWSLTGTTFFANDVAIPAIIVSGSCDNPDATGVVFEFRVTGTTEWAETGLCSTLVTKKEISGLTPNTEYDVAVSYIIAGIPGERQIIGSVFSGAAYESGGGPAVGDILFTTDVPGTWNFYVPDGVATVKIEIWGGGGGGSRDKVSGSWVTRYGGGGGGYARLNAYAVTAGQHLQGTIGNGGKVGSGGSGINGGDSAFYKPGLNMNATKGFGAGVGFAGAGGSGANGDVAVSGDAGSGTDGGGAGNGGGYQTTLGAQGTTPGGGGAASSLGPGYGAPGRVTITKVS